MCLHAGGARLGVACGCYCACVGCRRRHTRASATPRRAPPARSSQGPYLLGGHSYGGTVAMEVALVLESWGHEVGLVMVRLGRQAGGWELCSEGFALPRHAQV